MISWVSTQEIESWKREEDHERDRNNESKQSTRGNRGNSLIMNRVGVQLQGKQKNSPSYSARLPLRLQ